MIASWMLYGTVVALMLAGAAFCLERALPGAVPRRWIWASALAGTMVVPLVDPAGWGSLLRRGGANAVGGDPGQVLVLSGVRVELGSGAEVAGSWLDPLLLMMWIALSSALLIFGTVSLLRLRREMRGWAEAEVSGKRVRVAPEMGPAVAGFVRGVIVLPTWALGITPAEQDAMLRHEAEHVRRRDPILLLLAYLFLVALPWNLPLWWMVHRLRLAVELDCDARVLRSGTDPQLYGRLLLQVATMRRGVGGAATVLFAHPAFLERRIRRLMEGGPRGRALSLAGTIVAATFVLVACEVKTPVQTAPAPAPSAAPEADVADLSAEPVLTPFEVRPELLNRAELARAIELAYPPELRSAGIGGRVVLWVFSDAAGVVRQTRVAQSSGHPELDEAAQAATLEARFRPAMNEGEPVAVWIQMPVLFMTRSASPDTAPPAVPPAAPPLPSAAPPISPPPPPAEPRFTPFEMPAAEQTMTPSSPEPTFTPFEERPELLDRSAFAAALAAHYPADLRAAGVEGTAILWVMLDEEGVVTSTRLVTSSGHDALDEAAARALRETAFRPARMEGRPVTVWIQMPVTLRPR